MIAPFLALLELIGAQTSSAQLRLTHSELCGIVFHQSTRPLERLLRTGAAQLTSNQVTSLIRTYQDELRRSPEGSPLSAKILGVVGSNYYRLALFVAPQVERKPFVLRSIPGGPERVTLYREEAISEVYSVLPNILSNFDPSRGISFSTYFGVQLKLRLPYGYVMAATGNSTRLRHDSYRIGTTAFVLREQHRQQHKYLTDEELLQLLKVDLPNLTVDSLQGHLAAYENYNSSRWRRLDAPLRVSEDGEVTHLQRLVDDSMTEERSLSILIGDQADLFRFREEVLNPFRIELTRRRDASRKVNDRNKWERFTYIWDHRLLSEEPMTLAEIGRHFGLSRERIRQFETALLDSLRDFIEHRRFTLD